MILPLPRRFSERGRTGPFLEKDRPLFGEEEAPLKKRGSFAKRRGPVKKEALQKKRERLCKEGGSFTKMREVFLKKERIC